MKTKAKVSLILFCSLLAGGDVLAAEKVKLQNANFGKLFVGMEASSAGENLGTFNVTVNDHLIKEKVTNVKFFVDDIFLQEGGNTLTIEYDQASARSDKMPHLEIAVLDKDDPGGEDLSKSSVLLFSNNRMPVNFWKGFEDDNPLKKGPLSASTTLEVSLNLSGGLFTSRPMTESISLSEADKEQIQKVIVDLQQALNSKNLEQFTKLHAEREKYSSVTARTMKSDMIFNVFTRKNEQYSLSSDLKYELVNDRFVRVVSSGSPGVLYYTQDDFSSGIDAFVFAKMQGKIHWIK